VKAGRHPGVFEDNRRLYTLNLAPGFAVYGEPLIKEGGKEFREWNPFRSKLASSILKGIPPVGINRDSIVLYLGAATGTTVSHISDICSEGIVFAVEFSPEVFTELFLLSKRRPNIVPILADAAHPEAYYHRVAAADVVYQDIAQRNQVDIFVKNATLFLKRRGKAILCVKSRSIDVTQQPAKVFGEVREVLTGNFRLLDYKTLAPFQKDHAVFLVENRKL